MNRYILALGGAVAALAVGHSWAQQGFGQGGSCKQAPPGSGEQLCIDQRAWYDQSAPASHAAVTPAPTAVATDTSAVASTPIDNPPAAEPETQHLAVNDNPQTAAATASQPVAEAAPAPSAADVSVTTASTNMAYAKDIANAPHGAFKAKVGNYKMHAYASPPRPLPYDQLDAYLKASPKQQASNDWWKGSSQLAEATAPTSSSGNVSATVPAPSNSQAGIPGDTPTSLNRDTPAPQAPVNPAPTPAVPTPPDQTIDNTPI